MTTENQARTYEEEFKSVVKRVDEKCELATRETQGTAPDAHRTLQTIFNELNDPESGESERWVKIEEILHQYFRSAGTHPPQEGA